METTHEQPPAEFHEVLQRLELELECESGAERSFHKIRIVVNGTYGHVACWSFRAVDNACEFSVKFHLRWGTQAKYRLLRAIGTCRTVREIDLDRLTRYEVELVLAPMESNPVLGRISVCDTQPADPTDASDECTAEVCVILERILLTSRTLDTLVLDDCLLSAADAYHLASGLQGNPESALADLQLGKWEEPSVVKQIARIILSARNLRTLSLLKLRVIDDDGLDSVADALAQSTSLKHLALRDIEKGASALLFKAWIDKSSNHPITSVEFLGSVERIGDLLSRFVCSSQSLTQLTLGARMEDLSTQQWQGLGHSLFSSSSMECFRLGIHLSSWRTRITPAMEELLSAADMINPRIEVYLNSPFDSFDGWPCSFNTLRRTSENLSEVTEDSAELEQCTIGIQKPTIELHLFSYADETAPELLWSDLANAISSNLIPVSSLYLQLGPWLRKGPQVEIFLDALRDTSTLQEITIDRGYGKHWPGGWKQMFACLRYNTTITKLKLIDCNDLDDDGFKVLMEVLQVNWTLKSIKLERSSWQTDGKATLIREALRRNAQQESYFATFRKAGLKFGGAKAGRLFLCGSQFAGKTQLRQTMIREVRGRWMGSNTAQLGRTKGIEVEPLAHTEHMHVSVWDLAGQWIFRTLQDILFPRTSHASVFLFVFNPYDRENRCIKTDLDQSFKKELEEWLRFIASNSRFTQQMLPKVLIVISHMDKMKVRDDKWAHNIVDGVRQEFQDVVDVCNSGDVYQIDSRQTKQVTPLKDFILQTFWNLLENKSHIVPTVCSYMSSLLAKRMKDIKQRPLWPSNDFYLFCYDQLQLQDCDSIINSLKPATDSGLEVFKAIASYLHDIGSIVVIPNLDQIIVDPNWLTYAFLGELIAVCHNFKVNSSRKQTSGLPYSKTGFVSSSDLHRLLSSFMRSHPEYIDLDTNTLEELLIQFDLCFKIDDEQVSPRYYIPTIACEDDDSIMRGKSGKSSIRREPLSWSSLPGPDYKYFGFRVLCENSRTMSMTAALFPRFQIYIRNKLLTEMNLTSEDVICSRNYIHLCMDGHETFVERSDLGKNHIDVMVKCSQHKPREIAVQYIRKHIVDELITFCASSKGCPGVTLVVAIIQTKCVENLIPLEWRGERQVILIEQLKELQQASMGEQLEEIELESWSGDPNALLNYEHPWPPIPGYLPRIFELARDLLSESEMENLTRDIRRRSEQQLESLHQITTEMSEEIKYAEDAVGAEAGAVHEDVTPEASSPPVVTSESTPSYTSRATFGRLLSRIDRLEHKVDSRFDKVDVRLETIAGTLGRIEKEVVNIMSLHHKVQSSLNLFMSKMDQLIGYAESEQAQTPKRPYLSFENVSLFHRITAAWRVGTPVRLHFMCESVAGPHIVKDQPGLELCIEKENREWLRCIYDISFKMMYYLVKAGLHATLGLGQAVPELDNLGLGAILPLSIASAAMDSIRADDSTVTMGRRGNINSEEAWTHLRSVLGSKLKDNNTNVFNLYRVKYLNLEEGRCAWVCYHCMSKGIRSKSLESF